MPSVTLILRIVVSLLIGLLLAGILWRILDQPRKSWKMILVAMIVLSTGTFGSLAGLETIPARPVEIKITSPQSGTIIKGLETTVAGTVSPPNTRVIILVHPVDSNRWWVQRAPRLSAQESNPAESHWETRVYLGDETRGMGEGFEIIALGSQDLLLDLLTGRYYQTGDEVYALPPLSRSNVVSLCRECENSP